MEAIKIDDTGSVLIKTEDNLQVWVDVWTNDGELIADWNKYIFNLNNSEDVQIKSFQEDSENFDEATSLAIEYYKENYKEENKNTEKQSNEEMFFDIIQGLIGLALLIYGIYILLFI